MSAVGGPESPVAPVPPVPGVPPEPSVPRALPDAGHLDLDAECLEDPVHCGDARHQHEAHAAHPDVPDGPDAQPG
jgi:hypothetical protein